MSTDHDHSTDHKKDAAATPAWLAYLPAITAFVLLIGGIAIDQLAPLFWQQPWW
ncbi:MAG: hypothetical protein JNM91_06820, partial [Flavobacteriales bacterium]|nr:hypothetical protein [Flavobacteriales bacterium]